MPQLIATLDQPYVTMGVTWAEEFLVIQNEARAAIGYPPVLLMGSDALSLVRLSGVDIAQGHSENQAALTMQAHESALFPVGWRSLTERLDLVTQLSGAENLHLQNFFTYDTRDYWNPTPREAYDAWYASPLHREVLMMAFTPLGVPVYSSFGLAVSDACPAAWGPYGLVSSLFLTNVFMQLEAVSMDVIFSQCWESNGCIIGVLDQEYELLSYTKVKAGHESSYHATVAGYVESPFAYRVAAAHETTSYYGMTASVEAEYGACVAIPPGSHTSSWDTRLAVVSVGNESIFSLAVTQSNEAAYSQSAYVLAQSEADYDYSPIVRYGYEVSYERSPVVSIGCETGYERSATVLVAYETDYGRTPVAAAGNESSYGPSVIVAAGNVTEYSQGPLVLATHTVAYAVYPRIVATNESSYSDSLRIAAYTSSEYGDRAAVRWSLEVWYEDLKRVTLAMDMGYEPSTKVKAKVEADYTATTRVSATNSASSLLPTPVRASSIGAYALSVNNRVVSQEDSRYTLENVGALFDSRAVSLIHGTRTTRVSDGYVSASIGNAGYEFQVQIDDLATYRAIAILDTVVLDFAGELYALVVTSKTMARSSPASVTATISGLSPVYLKDLPYAEPISYTPATAMLMSEIVQGVLGVAVAWEVVDWLIPIGRAQAANSTPLAFVKTLLASVLASIQSRPDGTLVARYDYPTNWDILKSISISQSIEELSDVLSVSVGYEYRKAFNKFRIKDSDTPYRDTIEWDMDTQVATVTPYPYRSSWVLATTSLAGINIDALGENTATVTDTVEFKLGVGSLTKPIIQIVSIVWLSADLGGAAFDSYSNELRCGTTVNFGYGLATVTYLSKSYKFNVTASTPVDAAQLLVKEN